MPDTTQEIPAMPCVLTCITQDHSAIRLLQLHAHRSSSPWPLNKTHTILTCCHKNLVATWKLLTFCQMRNRSLWWYRGSSSGVTAWYRDKPISWPSALTCRSNNHNHNSLVTPCLYALPDEKLFTRSLGEVVIALGIREHRASLRLRQQLVHSLRPIPSLDLLSLLACRSVYAGFHWLWLRHHLTLSQ